MSISPKWIVEQKYYDDGKVKVNIWGEDEAKDKGFPVDSSHYEELSGYDLYTDPFETYEQAAEFAAGARNA